MRYDVWAPADVGTDIIQEDEIYNWTHLHTFIMNHLTMEAVVRMIAVYMDEYHDTEKMYLITERNEDCSMNYLKTIFVTR